jgi:hypothetical protein
MRLRLSCFGLCALLLAAPAAGDVTIRYAPVPPSEHPLIVEADGTGRMRAEIGPSQFIFMRDGDIFVVTPGEGQPIVSRLDDFLVVAGEAASAYRRSPPTEGAIQLRTPPQMHFRLAERGQESVGAWRGARFAIEQAGPHNPAFDTIWVASSDPALAEANRAMTRLFQVQFRIVATVVVLPPEMPAIMRQLAERGVPLRMTMTNTYRLESADAAPVPADHFDLPGPVLTRDQFRARQAH